MRRPGALSCALRVSATAISIARGYTHHRVRAHAGHQPHVLGAGYHARRATLFDSAARVAVSLVAPRRPLRHPQPAPAPVAAREERVHLWGGAAPEGSHGRPRCGCGGGRPPPCGCWPAARAPAPRHHPPAPAAAAQGQQGAAGEELRVCGGYAFPPSMFRQGDKGETALLLPFRSHLAVSAAWLLLRRCPFDCFVVLGSTLGATRESCVPRTVRVRIYHGARATALCAGAHGIVDDGARNLFRRHRL